MRRLYSIVLVAAFVLPASGCIVRTRDRHHHHHQGSKVRRGCPPSYHMEGGVCVHNGKAKGHHKRNKRR